MRWRRLGRWTFLLPLGVGWRYDHPLRATRLGGHELFDYETPLDAHKSVVPHVERR
ncbi:MAG TPA: hypothetical protein VKZ18_04940 [Polyangia bacterium]|nr:hypothetical protein [Polyangia bacterium]